MTRNDYTTQVRQQVVRLTEEIAAVDAARRPLTDQLAVLDYRRTRLIFGRNFLADALRWLEALESYDANPTAYTGDE